MTIIKISLNENGSHDNQTMFDETPETFPIPEGYAILPDSVGAPDSLENFPFGEVTWENVDSIPTITSWSPLPFPKEDVNQSMPTPEERLEAVEAAILSMMGV